ncbi:hypothetical protein HanPSC8_Chr17g0762501 [Helianthus annuus]|nr:hypothetical protein HanPSC8_Chr17g0762501 [Helianthus annuus]
MTYRHEEGRRRKSLEGISISRSRMEISSVDSSMDGKRGKRKQ